MAPIRIEPDLDFIRELQDVGGDSLKKCYQCATCSVACPISPDANPYPRKEMIWGAWGLKDKLEHDIDVWLCHNCGTCSDLCPRGAKPAALMSAMRNMIYRKLVKPSIVGEWMSSAKGLPMLMGIPAVLFLIVWIIRAAIVGSAFPTTPEGDIVYSLIFYGDYTIDPIFGATALFVAYTFFIGVKKIIDMYRPEGKTVILGTEKPCLLKALKDTVVEVVAHSKFEECNLESKDRKLGHMTLLFAFIALFIVTSIVAAGHWSKLIFSDSLLHTPMSLLNPIKILANAGAILMIFGLTLLTRRRLALDPAKHNSSFYDWYLLGVLWGVGITGILAEIFRLVGTPVLAYSIYYLHLVSVFMLFAYLPWSKLGHLVYRTAAMTYARYIGRRPL